MRTLFTLAFFAIIIGTSCNKQNIQRDRLEGMWIYEKVTWHKKAFCNEDILAEYLYVDVYFTKNNSVKMVDIKTGQYLQGTYLLHDDLDSYTDAEGNQQFINKTQMAVNLTDTATKQNYLQLWDEVQIGKNKMSFQQKRDGKNVFYKLRRQPL